MARIEIDVYEDDDNGQADPQAAEAQEHMEVYLRIEGRKYLLMVGFEEDGTTPCVWWDEGAFGGDGDPTKSAEPRDNQNGHLTSVNE